MGFTDSQSTHHKARALLQSVGYMGPTDNPQYEKTVDRIASSAKTISLVHDESIYQYGEESNYVFFLEANSKGFVSIRSRNLRDGNEFVSQIVLPGQVFGLDDLIRAENSEAGYPQKRNSAMACGESISLVRIPYNSMKRQLVADPFLRIGIANEIAESLIGLEESYGDVVSNVSIEVRLAEYLMWLGKLIGQPEGKGFRIKMPYGQSTIADHLNVGRTKVSRQMAQWSKRGLISDSGTKTLRVPDQLRLRKLTFSQSPSILDHQSVLSDVQSLFDAGHWFASRNVAFDGLALFPNCARMEYLVVLATARMNAPEEAERLLDHFGYLNLDHDGLERRLRSSILNPLVNQLNIDEDNWDCPAGWNISLESENVSRTVASLLNDFLVIKPRITKDQAFLMPPGELRQTYLSDAAAGYLRAFQVSKSAFHLVNAVSIGRMAHTSVVPSALIRKMTESVAQDNYWHCATHAELAIATDDVAKAVHYFKKANTMADATVASKATTRRQLVRLRDQGVERIDQYLTELQQPGVCVYTGHRYLDSSILNLEDDSFESLRAKIDNTLRDQRIEFAYGSLAAGADLLFAECVIKSGAELHVVLPITSEKFISLSVVDSAVANREFWETKFNHCLQHAASISTVHQGPFKKVEYDSILARANDHAIGLASMHADEIESDCTLVAIVTDHISSEGPGATNMRDNWEEAGFGRALTIACPWTHASNRNRKRTSKPCSSPSSFKYCLSIWIEFEITDRSKHTPALVEETLSKVEAIIRMFGAELVENRDTASTTYGVLAFFNDASGWPTLTTKLRGTLSRDVCKIRLMGDYHLIPFNNNKQIPLTVARRIYGWSDIPGLPELTLCASEQLATEARYALSDIFRVTRMGLGSDVQHGPRSLYRIDSTVD